MSELTRSLGPRKLAVFSKIATYFLPLVLAVLLSPALAQGKSKVEQGKLIGAASPTVLGASPNMLDGVSFIDKCLQASDAYSDYSFDYSMTVYKKNGTVVEKGRLYFKQPKMIRIEEKSGPKAGCVAVVQRNGQVRGHMGGPFKFFVATLSADSAELRSANGWPLVESDFSGIWRAMQGYAKEGCPAKVTAQPVSEPSQPSDVFVLEMTKNGQMYKRALIEPKTLLPVEWWDYKDGQVFAHSLWTNFKGNQGLSDKLFTL